MTARFALDTNVLIYALARTDDRRCVLAFDLVTQALATGAIVPMQVLGEFLNVCRRKNVASTGEAIERIIEWQPLFTLPATGFGDLTEAALLAERHRLAFFDALICVIARSAGAEFLLSEDMQDGLVLAGLTIVNPFAERNVTMLATIIAGDEAL